MTWWLNFARNRKTNLKVWVNLKVLKKSVFLGVLEDVSQSSDLRPTLWLKKNPPFMFTNTTMFTHSRFFTTDLLEGSSLRWILRPAGIAGRTVQSWWVRVLLVAFMFDAISINLRLSVSTIDQLAWSCEVCANHKDLSQYFTLYIHSSLSSWKEIPAGAENRFWLFRGHISWNKYEYWRGSSYQARINKKQAPAVIERNQNI